MWPQLGILLVNENEPRSGRDVKLEDKDFKRVIIKANNLRENKEMKR